MTEVLITILLAGLGGWVILPFFLRTTAADRRVDTSQLVEEKANVYRSIIELERDFYEGKVSPEDKQILIAQYERDAARILREIDGQAPEATLDVLEEEIAAARKRLRGE
jgi:hypothetical protein